MDRNARRQWIAAEVMGLVTLIVIGGLVDMRHYGMIVLVAALGSAIVAVVIGLRALR
jgi:hypothetical protein